MTKNRIDHTDCGHGATPAERKRCRDARRKAISEAQRMFEVLTPGDIPAWDEYNATVQLLAYRLHVTLEEAYAIVEDGPVIFA